MWGEKRETERQKQGYTSMWTSAKRLHGPVVGIPEVEEKAHLWTVWHHPPSGCVCVLCGERRCVVSTNGSLLVSHHNGAEDLS